MEPLTYRKTPFRLINRSQDILLFLTRDEQRGNLYNSFILPRQELDQNSAHLPLIVSFINEVILPTKKGIYHIEGDLNQLLQLSTYIEETYDGRRCARIHEKTSLEFSKLSNGLMVVIELDGAVNIRPFPAKPSDNRPNASLLAYDLIMGDLTYASPHQILGVTPESTINDLAKIYRTLMTKWHPDKNRAPEAKDAFNLIMWAYETLKPNKKDL